MHADSLILALRQCWTVESRHRCNAGLAFTYIFEDSADCCICIWKLATRCRILHVYLQPCFKIGTLLG